MTIRPTMKHATCSSIWRHLDVISDGMERSEGCKRPVPNTPYPICERRRTVPLPGEAAVPAAAAAADNLDL